MSESRDGSAWAKSPVELQEAFSAALASYPDAERRQMFGYPAAFANGNLWTSLHQRNWVVRLPDGPRAELLALEGAAPFEPMAGRPMSGFATLPPTVVSDPESLHTWLARAWQHALTMPPKESKAAKPKTSAKSKPKPKGGAGG